MKVVSVGEMVAVERAAAEAGHSYAAMMERAGRGLAEIIHARFGQDSSANKALALVGAGNNGGDALVALDYLQQWGWNTCGLVLRERQPDDSLVRRVVERGGSVQAAAAPEAYAGLLMEELQDTTVLIDGILGTGIKLPLRGHLAQLLDLTRKALAGLERAPRVVAVDCPSGVDCDSGQAAPECIPADVTATMAAVKKGLLQFPAYGLVGKLELVDIGLPADLPAWTAIQREIIARDEVAASLPPRPLDAHKGSFGTALILAGSQAYPGAAVLAARSAYRIGAGLVTLAVPERIYLGLIEAIPEATWVVLAEGDSGILAPEAGRIKDALKRPTGCLIGPGWGTGRSTAAFLAAVLALKEQLPPLVIDADGLRLLAGLENWPDAIPDGCLLTPHPGEMAALCGLSAAEIQADRIGAAERYAREWNQIVLLKGAHTVISHPDGRSRVLLSADPALARAGSGDVLSGILVGLIAQGMEPFSAAAAGSWIHARAGALAAAAAEHPAAVLAGGISEMIGRTLAELAG